MGYDQLNLSPRTIRHDVFDKASTCHQPLLAATPPRIAVPSWSPARLFQPQKATWLPIRAQEDATSQPKALFSPARLLLRKATPPRRHHKQLQANPTPYYSLVHTEDPLPGSKFFTRHQRSIQIYQNGQTQHNLLHHRIVHNGLIGRLKTPAVFTRCLSLSFSFLCQIEFRWIKNL